MSTTYYAVLNCCEHCGRSDHWQVAHTAGGWMPSFYAYPDGPRSVADWQALADDHKIAYVEDEYGTRMSWADFMEKMQARNDALLDGSPLLSHSANYGEGLIVDGWEVLDGSQYGGRETIVGRHRDCWV